MYNSYPLSWSPQNELENLPPLYTRKQAVLSLQTTALVFHTRRGETQMKIIIINHLCANFVNIKVVKEVKKVHFWDGVG